MTDGGLVLCESMAACHYLANTYTAQGNPLFPTDPEQYAATIQACRVVGVSVGSDASVRAVLDRQCTKSTTFWTHTGIYVLSNIYCI